MANEKKALESVKMVNVLSGKYAGKIAFHNMPYQEATNGGSYYMAESFADSLLLTADKTNQVIVLESGLRVPGQKVTYPNGKTGTSKDSHAIGRATDIYTTMDLAEAKQYFSSGKIPEAAVSDRVTRRETLGGVISTDPEIKQHILWGGDIYSSPSERNHIESADNRAILDAMTKDTKVKVIAAAESMSQTRWMDDVHGDGNGDDKRVVSYDLDLATGKVSNTEYLTRAEIKARAGNLASDHVPANNNPDIAPRDNLVHQVSASENAAYSRNGSTGADPFTDALGGGNASNGKGSVNNWVSFNPSNVIVPNMKDGKVPRIVEIDSRQFNNSINNYADMAQVKKITNKLIKNAMPNKHPFGEQLKHDGAPAAIKLILDEVFKDKRTDAAVKAWERLVAAKIDYIDNFVVERFAEVNSERYQISQSVTDDYKIYFSGKSPVIMNITGHMLNTYNQQWWHDFDYFYDNYLRGSKAVENKIRAFLTIADTIYDILILKFGVNGDGNFDGVVQYNIDFVSLQKIHIGEYKNPEYRDNSVKDLSKSAPMSTTQTEFDDNTKKLIDNISKDANGSGARGVPGTNTDKKANLTWQEEMLNDANYLDNRKIITPDNNANLSTGNSGNTKIAREDLKKTPNANLQQQVRLSRSLVHSDADLERLQNTANDNRKEKNLLVTKSTAPEGQEVFGKGANKPYNRYENAVPLLPADSLKIFSTGATSADAVITDSKSLYDNITKDARAFAADQTINLAQLKNLINTQPKTAADFAAIANNAMPILTNVAAQTGEFTNDKEKTYTNSARRIDVGVKNTLKLSGQALNAISKQLSDAFNNKGV